MQTTLPQTRVLFDVPNSRWHITPIATRGERLALSRVVFEGDVDAGGGPLAIDYVNIDVVDGDGLLGEVVMFEPTDLDAAYAELDRRHETGEGAAYVAHGVLQRAFLQAITSRDWDPVIALCAPTFVEYDHRHLAVLGTTRGGEAWARNFSVLTELAPDTVMRFDHLRYRARGFLFQVTWRGTREGGDYEIVLVGVIEVDEDGRYARANIYDADQLDEACARFAELAAPIAAPQHFANAASRWIERCDRCWRASDWNGIKGAFSPAFRIDDRHRLIRLEVGVEDFLVQFRMLFDQPGSRFERELLATRGERLALGRALYRAEVEDGGGRLEFAESLTVYEVGADGQCIAFVLFDVEDEDTAYAELDARWEAGEAAAHEHMRAALRAFTLAFARRDWDAIAALLAPDFVRNDYRLLGWGPTSSSLEMIQTQEALVELAPDAELRRPDHVRMSGRACFMDGAVMGTREGGAFEIPALGVFEIDDLEKLRQVDLYDPEQFDAAQTRFEEAIATTAHDPLAAIATPPAASVEIAAPPAASVLIAKPNAASAVMDRWQTAFEAGFDTNDWNVLRGLCAPAMTFEDRRRLALISGNCELMIASARERAAVGARPRLWPMGTAGDRVGVWRMLCGGGPADGRFEIEYYAVTEVDEAGLISAIVLIDLDDARAAQREAWARWSAIDPAATPWVRLVSTTTDSFNGRDLSPFRAIFTEDVVVEDHRRTGFGRIEGRDAYLDAVAVLWELAPDTRIEIGWYWPAYDRHVAVCTLRRWGTIVDGGAFESDYLILYVMTGGLVTHVEMFEVDALDAALARFEDLRQDPLRIPPNAATRAYDSAAEASDAHDWAAVRALLSDDFAHDDRGKRALLSGGVEELIAGVEYLVSEVGAESRYEVLGTAGERIAIHRRAWRNAPDAAPFELDKISVTEVDAVGKVHALILFDDDDRTAAFQEASERFAAGEAATSGGHPEYVELSRAFREREWDTARELLAPDFAFVDHRTLGMGTLDRDRWIESLQALAELAPDLAQEMFRALAWNRDGLAILTRGVGTVPGGGGPFENEFAAVVLAVGEKLQRYEVFEMADTDRAVARFEELCAERAT